MIKKVNSKKMLKRYINDICKNPNKEVELMDVKIDTYTVNDDTGFPLEILKLGETVTIKIKYKNKRRREE